MKKPFYAAQELRDKIARNEKITHDDVQIAAAIARSMGRVEDRVLYAAVKRKANESSESAE